MGTGEFQLIERHLSRLGAARDDVVLGVGDDAALVQPPPPPARLVVASASASGTGDPATIARACFDDAAAALRDAGARPAWLTLALTLERPDEDWVQDFAAALDTACRDARVSVVGGDTTAGPPAVSVFLTGILEA